jgi:hypothetical protein
MEKHERNRLEATLKKMLENLAQAEEKRREAKEERPRTQSTTGNLIRRRKGKKDRRLTANLSEQCPRSPSEGDLR